MISCYRSPVFFFLICLLVSTQLLADGHEETETRASNTIFGQDFDIEDLAPELAAAGINADLVSQHEVEPPNVRGVDSDLLDDVAADADDLVHEHRNTPPDTLELNIEEFFSEMDMRLRREALGYVLVIQREGNVELYRRWQEARTARDDYLPWSSEITQHVASISKMITAAALIKLLDENGVSLDEKLVNVLPTYWKTDGPYVHEMTLRQVLRHRAGLGFDVERSGPVTIGHARQIVAKGANRPIPIGDDEWPYNYDNGNYTIARVLMPIIAGKISRDASFSAVNDKVWNIVSLRFYEEYVREHIFEPAGLSDVSLGKRDNNALAYETNDRSAAGWNSGDLHNVAGPVGWHFSAAELLQLAAALRAPGLILSERQLSAMQAEDIGFQPHWTNENGLYYHGGRWSNDGRAERSFLYFLPNGVEMVMLFSSARPAALTNAIDAGTERSVQNVIGRAYLNNVSRVPAPLN